MKKVGVAIFLILAVAISYYLKTDNERMIKNNIYNVKLYELLDVGDDVFVGNYTIKNLSDFNRLNENSYISFELDKCYLTQLFDMLHIKIVKKYSAFDKKIYDCYSDCIDINQKINIQIVVGDNIKIGIPTIFEGF